MDHKRWTIRQYLIVAAVSTLALSTTPNEAAAAAGDPIPGVDVNLEQIPGGFVALTPPCDTPNTVTDGGTQACSPAKTYNQLAGSPGDGWVMRPKTKIKLSMKPGKNKISHMLNPLTDVADVLVSLKIGGLEDSVGSILTSTGTLALVVRTSVDDRVGGSMTIVDYPFNFTFPVNGGKAALKTTINTKLNSASQPALPGSFSMMIVSAEIRDGNGNPFAGPGVSVAMP